MDSVHLFGAEDVRAAGVAIRNAAEVMRQTAENYADIFNRHERFMESLVERIEAAAERTKNDSVQGGGK